MQRVMVVGARPGGLGAAVADWFRGRGHPVRTAGISQEDVELNLVHTTFSKIQEVLSEWLPDVLVCTVGVNEPEAKGTSDSYTWYLKSYAINVGGPMRLLSAWWASQPAGEWAGRHYVAVSSNSARVPRSGSAAYCASKAGLSMALRVKAREYALAGGPVVWGIEPGLVAGTPMTEQTAERWPGQPLTRMRPPELSEGISAATVAGLIGAGVQAGMAMNGVLLPVDADES